NTDANIAGSDDGLAIDDFYLGLLQVNTSPTVIASPLNVNFGNQTVGATNFDYDLTVSGVNLTGSTVDVISNIPGVALLLNGTGTGASMISLPIVGGSVDPTRIVYGLSVSTSSSTGPVSGTVDITTSGVSLQTVTLTANIIGPAPYLNVTPSLLDFGSIVAGTSSIKSFTLSGFNLTSDLTISGVSGVFEVSANGIDGFWPSISLTTGGPSFAGPILVKFLPNAASSFSGLVNCISAGATYDVSVSGAGFSASGTGKVTASNPESLGTIIGTNTTSYNNIWRRGTINQAINLDFSILSGNITKITSLFPPQFSFTSVSLLGTAFASATVSVDGNEFTILGANLTSTTAGTVKLNGVSIPNPPSGNLGKYKPFIYTGDDYGPILGTQSPTLFVTVPISNIRDVSNLNSEGGFVAGVLGDSAAIEGNSQIPTQAYASSNTTFNSLQVFIRDNSAALSIFRIGNAYPGYITTGTGMIVKGNLALFNNSNQLTVTADRNIILTGNSLPVPPIDVTIENLVKDPEVYEGYLIRILNVSLSTASLAWPVTNVRTTLNITDDGNLSKTNMLIPYVTSIPNLVFPTTSPAFPANVTGIFTQAFFATPSYASVPNGYQIIPLKISDIESVVATTNAPNTLVVNPLAYPNPMESNELFVSNPEMGTVKVFNGIGAEVNVVVTPASSNTSKVLFPESCAGIYYVSVQGKSQPTVIKVVK
ncbi:MAG: T9SS type A sorting domain-containing protein, partial [Cytophagales bacterium]|nr:T9SS type A sorting domain-containing protein [Cytophagales bacterium]